MLTSPSKVLYIKTKHTKQDVWEYYQRVFPLISRYIVGRPISLVRAPEGVERVRFYQRHPGEYFPSYIERITLEVKTQGNGVYFLVDELSDIEYLVNIGTIEFHVWGSTSDAPEYPDTILFDLDPGPYVTQDRLVEAAVLLREKLEWEGYTPYIKTSGIKGYHIAAPVLEKKMFSRLYEDARRIARDLETKFPRLFTDSMKKSDRKEKIFLDYLRNRYGATNIAPFSLRAWHRPTVSVPISWEELQRVTPESFTIDHVQDFLARSALWV